MTIRNSSELRELAAYIIPRAEWIFSCGKILTPLERSQSSFSRLVHSTNVTWWLMEFRCFTTLPTIQSLSSKSASGITKRSKMSLFEELTRLCLSKYWTQTITERQLSTWQWSSNVPNHLRRWSTCWQIFLINVCPRWCLSQSTSLSPTRTLKW